MLHHVSLAANGIVLRSIQQGDLSVLFDKLFGPEYATWRCWDGAEDPSGKITYVRFADRMQSYLDNPSFERWLLIEINHAIAGMVLYDWESRLTQTIEVGIALFEPTMWNKGYGTDALALWMDFIFRRLSPRMICLTTKSTNHRMTRCAEKLGLWRNDTSYVYQINGEERVRMTVSVDEWIKTIWCGISSQENIDEQSRSHEPHGFMWKV